MFRLTASEKCGFGWNNPGFGKTPEACVSIVWFYSSALNPRRGKAFQPVAGEPVGGPLIHGDRAQLLIEPDGWLIPVEDRPFHPAATTRHRDFGEFDEQCKPRAFSARVRFHVEILEVDARLSPERGIVREE